MTQIAKELRVLGVATGFLATYAKDYKGIKQLMRTFKLYKSKGRDILAKSLQEIQDLGSSERLEIDTVTLAYRLLMLQEFKLLNPKKNKLREYFLAYKKANPMSTEIYHNSYILAKRFVDNGN